MSNTTDGLNTVRMNPAQILDLGSELEKASLYSSVHNLINHAQNAGYTSGIESGYRDGLAEATRRANAHELEGHVCGTDESELTKRLLGDYAEGRRIGYEEGYAKAWAEAREQLETETRVGLEDSQVWQERIEVAKAEAWQQGYAKAWAESPLRSPEEIETAIVEAADEKAIGGGYRDGRTISQVWRMGYDQACVGAKAELKAKDLDTALARDLAYDEGYTAGVVRGRVNTKTAIEEAKAVAYEAGKLAAMAETLAEDRATEIRNKAHAEGFTKGCFLADCDKQVEYERGLLEGNRLVWEGAALKQVRVNEFESGKREGLEYRTLTDDQVEWVTNDISELGVKIGEQFFFMYKGRSLVYDGIAGDGSPTQWRYVFKREFGETVQPLGHNGRNGTVSLSDSPLWKPLPVLKK